VPMEDTSFTRAQKLAKSVLEDTFKMTGGQMNPTASHTGDALLGMASLGAGPPLPVPLLGRGCPNIGRNGVTTPISGGSLQPAA
jgi:hypothetical protein